MGRADEFSRVKPFLTANWRYLAMLNYVVDPRIIAPLVPPGTEIDLENGETFISVVGFLFLDTRLLALPMKHEIEHIDLNVKVAYSWRRGRKWESLTMTATGEPQNIPAGSHTEFI